MKISLILAPLIAAKVPHSVIMETVLAFENQQTDALEQRRANDRERQARKRLSRDVTVSHTGSRSRAGGEDNNLTSKNTGQEESVSPPAPRKRATRLPADWSLPDDWLAEALAAGMTEARALSEAERMKNWSLGTSHAVKIDWLATWRNWFKDKLDKAPSSPPEKPPPKARNAGEAARNELRKMDNDDEPHAPRGHFDARLGTSDSPGTGLARRFAIAPS